MRAVVQRVKSASVAVADEQLSRIQQGLLVLVGIGIEDTKQDADYILQKILNLRIFEDEAAKLNLSLQDIKGELMLISQFTLYGDCRNGRRPSFISAARPEVAEELYEYLLEQASQLGISVAKGKFQANMQVSLINDGPVTILIDSKKSF
ncbi:MAG: D-aminoacyl-tRNA deacylase [Clostridia bacterium]